MVKNKLSIIMTAYNVADYISSTIDSVIAQTNRNFDLIIVDDCSTDQTQKIIRSYAQKYDWISVICHAQNFGVSTARNTGLKNADGEFITSVSELVAICESEGFIPRYYITQPNDKVDETIADIQGYLKTLVTEEMNLGNLIDTAIQQMQQAEKEDAEEPIVDNDDDIDEVNDEDIAEFLDFKSAADVEAALSEEDEE